MAYIEFNCLPTIIGSLPHTDPDAACEFVARHLRDIPAWPQLPRRSFRENMYAQYAEGFPGAVIRDDKLFIDRAQDLDGALERLYAAYLANDIQTFPISPGHAAGLYEFLKLTYILPKAVKGQVTGPVSWGLTVTDNDGRSIIYDDTLSDAAARLLRLKAAWQEKELARLSKNTIIFIDEPYMSSFGSSYVPISRDKVIGLLEEVMGGVRGLKAVHCCGNTDWSVLLATSLDILSFDTYGYAGSLALFPAEVKKLLERGGAVAWGVVPNDKEALGKETAATLKDRLEEAMAPFTRKGIAFRKIVAQSLLTPCCGLASLTIPEAEQAMRLLTGLSDLMRSRYT